MNKELMLRKSLGVAQQRSQTQRLPKAVRTTLLQHESPRSWCPSSPTPNGDSIAQASREFNDEAHHCSIDYCLWRMVECGEVSSVPSILHSSFFTFTTPAPLMASCLRAIRASFTSSKDQDCTWVWTGMRAASARNSRPSARVLLATVRTTRSP